MQVKLCSEISMVLITWKVEDGKPFGDPELSEQSPLQTFPEATDALFSLPSSDGMLTQGTFAPHPWNWRNPIKQLGSLNGVFKSGEKNLAWFSFPSSNYSKNHWF